jgi:hypothetical protein
MRSLILALLLAPSLALAQHAPSPGAGTPVVTATGSTTARSLADRAATTKNVLDFGAVCNGTIDDTAAIRAANAAIPAGGGVLYIPPGYTCGVAGVVYLASNTHVQMYGATLLMLRGRSSFFMNASYNATKLTDSNITVEGGTLDYGSSGARGGIHAIEMRFVNHVQVLHVIGQGRGAGDLTAFIGTNDTLIDGCSGFAFTNATYDHWWGPTNARVVNSFASTASSAQMVNFNPEKTSGDSTGEVADGFVLSGNTFIATGARAIPMQLEPLGSGTTAKNVSVTNNVFKNVQLVSRRAIQGETINGNVFSGVAGGAAAIDSYPMDGGTPDSIVVSGNTFVNPATAAPQQGVIRVVATNSSITGNTISGSSYYAATYTGKYPVVISGNNFPSGIYQNTGSAWVSSSHP